MDEQDIGFDINGGPVIISIRAELATAGKFTLAIRLDTAWSEFGRGSLGDGIPDDFVVPLEGQALAGRFVLIIGNYAPPNPANPQISVDYVYLQRGVEIGRTPIRAQGVAVRNHLLRFMARP